MRKLLSRIARISCPTLTRRFIYGYCYNLMRNHLALKAHHVLLESHHGSAFGGNPYHLAAHLVSNPEYRHLHLIMVGPPEQAQWLRQRLPTANMTTVKPGSLRYAYHLATSKWLISDVTFPLYFNRRTSQKYLNTWHGTPLKTLGRDSESNVGLHLVNIQRNFLHTSFIIAPNPHTEEVLLNAYCLKGIYAGHMLHTGYPRNDPLIRSRKPASSGHHAVYMPTWRGSLSDRQSDSQQQLTELTELLDDLDRQLPDSTTLWVKLHPMVVGRISLDRFRRIKPFPKDVEAYEHLATCDILITDYSSVFFDFAATRRPIIRYIPDEAHYEADRGFCLDPGSLPFPCARTPAELVTLMQELLVHPTDEPESGYARFMEAFNALDRGTSTADACRAFFAEAPSGNRQKTRAPETRQRVALYIGRPAFLPDNYATLLTRLDTDRYTFILLIEADAITPEWEGFLKELDPAFLCIAIRFHAHVAPLELFRLIWNGITSRGEDPEGTTWRTIGKREYRRLFGDSALDVLISLDGTDIGSRLLASGRDWEHSHCLAPDDITPDQLNHLEWLQTYCRQ